ncbi:MAG: hypothetical protein LQ350_004404 [Teloschistes chrysophthalmus]|nr:MAG: hypothetical protein LQ350_004404 [Niorma chrysophthalma]
MELSNIVDEIVDWIPSINYNSSDQQLSVFETTIRYLGGMISGYDLLTGPLAHVASNASAVQVLLAQSVNLADALKYTFDTPTGIPHHSLFLDSHSYKEGFDNSIASVGTVQIEWQRLSDLSGNPEYGNLVQKSASYLLNPESEVWPGLLGVKLDFRDGHFTDLAGGWGASSDSFYEYLIKMYVYDSSRYKIYRDRWILAADLTMKHLASQSPTKPGLTFLASFRNQTIHRWSGHLNCFAGGNFILGGQVLDRQDYIDFGLKLVDGCHATYNSTLTGLGPEGFGWDPNHVPENQQG